MEVDNPQLVSYLQGLRPQIPTQIHAQFDELSVLYEKRLWHQLTIVCENLFAATGLPKAVLISLFRGFIQKWSKKMNQLSYTKLAVRVAELLPIGEAVELLEDVGSRIIKENLTDVMPVSYVLARVEVAQYYLQLGGAEHVGKARDYIDECIELVESSPTSPPVLVQASVYRISALYDKFTLNYAAFYRHTLLFLACLSPEALGRDVSPERQLEIAHDLCVSALLSDEIYNFGEIISTPILRVLSTEAAAEPYKFLAALLEAFSAGQLNALTQHSQAISRHPALSAHLPFLQEKLCLMGLAQFLFSCLKRSRKVYFKEISVATGVPLDQVEFLLIRAISVKIVRGIIDQVDGSITVNWIQPRLLDQNQIGDLLLAVRTWNEKVVKTSHLVEDMRTRGVFNEATSNII